MNIDLLQIPIPDIKHEEIIVAGTIADNIVQYCMLLGLSSVGSRIGSRCSHMERTVNAI